VLEAAVVAGIVSGLPSTAEVLVRTRSIRAAGNYVFDATARIGVLVPPFRPGLVRGAVAHAALSLLVAEAMGETLPSQRSVAWGGAAGLIVGVVTVGMIGRRIPAIRELPLGPQLADNATFGLVFAAIADRP
jgi:hypothetical protein